MLQRISKIIVLGSITLVSCEDSDNLDEVINDTWQLEWVRCGVFQNYYSAKIHFEITDTSNYCWYKEQNADTAYFESTIIDNQTLLLRNSSDEHWEGEVKVLDFTTKRLDLERSNKECENELYRFK